MKTKVPVLFIAFNRPDVTKLVWEAIRNYKPTRLYVSVDAPRENKPSEVESCRIVKEITESVDWECRVVRKYNPRNLGCRLGVSSAISWMFETEEIGIILEDDCLPSPAFFTFCEEMLERYKEDSRVMQISGNNYLPANFKIKESYYFSTLNDIWGWATWKRAWSKFSLELENFNAEDSKNILHNYFKNREIERWFFEYLKGVFYPRSQVWSTQWVYTLVLNNGFTITPKHNYVQNIGFIGESTNANSSFLEYQSIKASNEIDNPLVHPEFKINYEADKARFELIKRTDPVTFKKVIFRKKLSNIKQKLKSFF